MHECYMRRALRHKFFSITASAISVKVLSNWARIKRTFNISKCNNLDLYPLELAIHYVLLHLLARGKYGQL